MTPSANRRGDQPPAAGAQAPGPPSPEDALARVGRAFSHPIRIRIVLTLAEAVDASPLKLAQTTGAPLGTVSYHVRYLANLGAIELRRMEPRRGAMQHFYALAPALRLVLPLARQMGATAGIAQLGTLPPGSD